MGALKKKIVALGFICFFSFGLLPVSMSVCGPFTSLLSRHGHAKIAHRAVPRAPLGLKPAQPGRQIVESDLLPEEENGSGNSLQSSAAIKLAALPLPGSELSLASRPIFSGKVSTYLLQSVLNL